MKVLIKLGGTLLDEPGKLAGVAAQLAAAASTHTVAVVHGGGKQVTRFLEERGVSSRFVQGLRVSDETVIDAVVKVIAGSVNTRLVAGIVAAGRPAIGLSGVDGSLTLAEQLDPELGFVGRPTSTDGTLLNLLVGAGYLPVVACVAGDKQGNIYNVNADGMAVSCALGWQAERLIFLTDVPGVKDGSGHIARSLADSDIEPLITSGVAYGGMQAKLEAAREALRSGLRVTIAAGADQNICSRLLAGEAIGTELHA